LRCEPLSPPPPLPVVLPWMLALTR
jgi:hypothetical protein